MYSFRLQKVSRAINKVYAIAETFIVVLIISNIQEKIVKAVMHWKYRYQLLSTNFILIKFLIYSISISSRESMLYSRNFAFSYNYFMLSKTKKMNFTQEFLMINFVKLYMHWLTSVQFSVIETLSIVRV